MRFLAWLIPVLLAGHAALAAPDASALRDSVERGMARFRAEQATDGSFTALARPSSVIYNTYAVLLYEFRGEAGAKRETIVELMRYAWSQAGPDGLFSGYPGGPPDAGISALVYVAAKIAGEDDGSERMLKLERFIRGSGGVRKTSPLARAFLVLFGVDPIGYCAPATSLEAALLMDRQLPWVKVALYPMLYLISSGRIHAIEGSRFPSRIAARGGCPAWTPHPLRALHLGEKRFFRWLEAHLSSDGTMFDYAPTTIPTLMALSAGPGRFRAALERGLKRVEELRIETPQGLLQSPAESSVGETYLVMKAMLDMGYGADDPLLARAAGFLYDVQQKDTGAFGFSKHNLRFPDPDDSANALEALERLGPDAGHEAAILKGLRWVLSRQNRDGGFPTWDTDRDESAITRRALQPLHDMGFVLTESVTEHTARIILFLALFRDRVPEAEKAYERALDWLVASQRGDGSYPGTWVLGYQFGTSMALAGLGSRSGDPKTALAIERALGYLLARQRPDGSFSESPASDRAGTSIELAEGSPSQTGWIASNLLLFLKQENFAHWSLLKEPLARAVSFLLSTQGPDGLWHDRAWTGVTFPKVEYLVYPYAQEIEPLHAIGMYRSVVLSGHE